MEALHRQWEQAGLSDDYVFGKVMRNPELCKRMLELILGVGILRIEYPEEQKTIDLRQDAHGIRLDVYVRDAEGVVYNVEIQTRNTRELPQRSRYYQAMIDLDLIHKGGHYKEMNRSFVIFICTFDVFKTGRHIYTFENICKEDPSIRLGDGTTKIFLNAKGTLEDVTPELKAFLDYVAGEKSEDLFVQQLDEEVNLVKSNKEWRREYMTLYNLIEEGRQEGRQEGRREMIRKVLLRLKSAQETAEFLKIDIHEVWTIAKNDHIPTDDFPS